MYNGNMLHSVNLKFDSLDSEKTLEDAEESRLIMRNKMVQINYGKLNALYETFVPQQEFSVKQTYFSIPSTSNNGSEYKDVTSDLPIPKMPKESKLLKMFDTMGVAINGLQTRIDETLLEDRQQRKSNVKRALFTTSVAAKSKNLGTTFVVVKSRLSVDKTPKVTNKVEGLGHNLFSVGQFYDGDLEVAFRSNTCYVWNLEGGDLLTDSCDLNLYTISISVMAASFPMCLMSRATSTKYWLWYRILSYLNFGTINQLTSKDPVDGIFKFKYNKYNLCSACKQGKSKKASLPPKLIPSTESKLKLLHMDLCGPMRVASINGKKYILVIVDDYFQYTWIYFLHTKDEAPDMIIDFVNQL
uniref:Retrovirus-related Pol polyprotein from transposon TNT 1-94 n=1 Tax=Tanacetum cinerariifolium TaxID=118510 RepID=A0A699GWS3_TANCI|nr:retrovirus-related Pol polyprotein from transposon TNT 1-94 [Tanacetum cinerariifolium]